MISAVLFLFFLSISQFVFAGPDIAMDTLTQFSFGEVWDMEDNVSFSNNLLLPGMEANSNGVYPVVFDLNIAPDLLGIKAIEIEAVDMTGKTVVEEERVFTYDSRMVLPAGLCPENPGEVWFYRVRFINHVGRVSEWSDFHVGYGAITGDAFIKFFEKYAMKPWEFVDTEPAGSEFHEKWSGSEILEKVSAHSLKSLGDITEHSRFHDGHVNYMSKASGFKGNIYFTYENFGELESIKSTGSFNMIGVSLSGNGKKCEGSIKVEGMYPATVDMKDIVISNYNPTGNYILEQEGRDVEYIEATGNMSFSN